MLVGFDLETYCENQGSEIAGVRGGPSPRGHAVSYHSLRSSSWICYDAGAFVCIRFTRFHLQIQL